MTTDLAEKLDQDYHILPYEDLGSELKSSRRTHIINPPGNLHIWTPGMTSQDVVSIARLRGIEVVALCGYRFVPKRDPEKYDSCQECMDIAMNMEEWNG